MTSTIYRARLELGPLDGTEIDIKYVGNELRYPQDDEDGGRYVYAGYRDDSARGTVLRYRWQARQC